jgi:CRISPR-associated Csx10 family RAMP protein
MADEQDRFAAFKKRLDTLNDLIHGQAARYQLKGLQDRYFFSLTLHSPLILCDDLLRYRGTIDEIALEKMLHNCPPLLELQRVYQAASVRRVTGWQELWGTPRTNEYAIEMGSVFLFSCSSRPESAVFRALFALEENGAGKRRTEGFGRLSVSDQFHQEIEWR